MQRKSKSAEIQKHFRKNVAIVVLNDQGQLLACHRSDRLGAWQIPQGGINEEEPLKDAMLRELKEEIGTQDVSIIGLLPETISYDWPEELYNRGYHGQEQRYFLVRLNQNAKINLEAHNPQEFDSFEWLSASQFLERVSGFKQQAYTTAITLLKKYFPDMIAE